MQSLAQLNGTPSVDHLLWEDIIDGGAPKEQTEYIAERAWYKYNSLIYESD
jgi:hypothetical protein